VSSYYLFLAQVLARAEVNFVIPQFAFYDIDHQRHRWSALTVLVACEANSHIASLISDTVLLRCSGQWSNREADRVTTRNRRTDRPDRGPAGGGPRWVRANDIIGLRDQPSAVTRRHSEIDCCHGHSPNVSR
jgi:hypothetical protein